MKPLFREFKAFISRGNVMDLAVGVIMGSSFTAIVNSLVNDIFMPLISLLTGNVDFSSWIFRMGDKENSAVIKFGLFISAVINFILVALVVFLLVKAINRLQSTVIAVKEETPTEKECPYCCSKISVKATRCPYCASQLPEEAEAGSDEKSDKADSPSSYS